MSHWPFVAAAYGVTMIACALLVAWAWRTMTRSESRLAELDRR